MSDLTSSRIGPFGFTVDSGTSASIDDDLPSATARVNRLVSIMGSEGRTTLSVWRYPAGMYFLDVKPSDPNDSLMQAAGTTEAMTLEWGHHDQTGAWHLATVGRGGPRTSAPGIEIPYYGGEHSTLVYPDEVFNQAEATQLFQHYIRTETVLPGYVLREMDLTPYQETP